MIERQSDGRRARTILTYMAGGVLLAAGSTTYGCKDIVSTTLIPVADAGAPGAVGDPCVPTDEANPAFGGYKIEELTIESQFDGCQSGICLAYHFEGRTNCPLGQAAPTPCAGPSDTSCGNGRACVGASAFPLPCTPDGGASQCPSGECDAQTNTCVCMTDADCRPGGTACDTMSGQCKQYVCAPEAGCQTAGGTEAENAGKSCCAEGSSAPVSEAVCGQCAAGSGRSAAEAVYCSCRCGPADGNSTDTGPFCSCPDGFTCAAILPNFGLGDPELQGKYCIKQGTEYTSPDQCGQVQGHFDSTCSGASGP